jgi:hypothetical protein
VSLPLPRDGSAARLAREGPPMMNHKFKTGEMVEIISRRYEKPEGPFVVIRQMPSERGMNQYRIKSQLDGRERMVMENEVI